MNASRLKLHEELKAILGTNNVYFQPPESFKMVLPCIVYTRSNIKNEHAGDNIYKQSYIYDVTVLDKNPDSEIVERLSKKNYAVYERRYVLNNIGHDKFTVTYNKN